MQNYKQPGNYGYGYSQESNNVTQPFQSSSSVQFFDPNARNSLNNPHQGPQNLGYNNIQSPGYGQNPNYGNQNT
jgi:hypothetical protein